MSAIPTTTHELKGVRAVLRYIQWSHAFRTHIEQRLRQVTHEYQSLSQECDGLCHDLETWRTIDDHRFSR